MKQETSAKQEKLLQLQIPVALFRRVKVSAAQQDSTVKQVVIDAITKHIGKPRSEATDAV